MARHDTLADRDSDAQADRRRLRQLAKAGYWVITPHKFPPGSLSSERATIFKRNRPYH